MRMMQTQQRSEHWEQCPTAQCASLIGWERGRSYRQHTDPNELTREEYYASLFAIGGSI